MSNYDQTDIRRRAAKTVEVQEPLLDDNGDNIQHIKRPRPSLILRILSAIKWTSITFVISWYFEVLQGINKILEENTWTRKILYISFISLLIMLSIFIYLQYFIPFTKKVPPPNYALWKIDHNLKKFIPISTFFGTISVMSLLISFWHIGGFFGTPIIVFSILTCIVSILNIF